MSKKENDFYYSFTSPPVNSSSSSSTAPPPSAPPNSTEIEPPSYDDATTFPSSSSSTSTPVPPPNKSNLEGYVLDSSSPPFNPNVLPMPEPITMPVPPQQQQEAQPRNTSDYGTPITIVRDDEAPLLGGESGEYDEYEHFSSTDNYAGRPAPPGYSVYRAKYKTVKEGVISRDKHLNEDGEALLQFLYQHNKRPGMIIHFYGYHEETEWRTVSKRNSDGELVEEREPTTRRIDDFNFDMDVSNDVSDVCQGMYILPDPKTGDVKTLRELCNEYVHETNILKELKLTKEINWDYNGLTRGLTTAIRNSGFYENIEISFKMQNHEIIVKTDHKISRWIDNKVLRFIFFISCLWILVWPVIWIFRKKFGHSTLKSAWNMNVSERDWYNLHVQDIISNCRGKSIFFFNRSKQPSNNFSVNIF